MEPILIDLNDIASGKVELTSFKTKVDSLDVSPYQNKHVRIQGCAPTWAHLLVAGKLFPHVDVLDFIIDDGKEGKVVNFFTKKS